MTRNTPLSSKATAFVPNSSEYPQYGFDVPMEHDYHSHPFTNSMNFVGYPSISKGDYTSHPLMNDMNLVGDAVGKDRDKGKGKYKEGKAKRKGKADGPPVLRSKGSGVSESGYGLQFRCDTHEAYADVRHTTPSSSDYGTAVLELEELLQEALAEAGGPLLLEDFDAPAKQFLAELMLHDRASPGSHRSVEAIDFIFEHTRNKKRETLSKPATYVFSLLQKFDPTIVSEKVTQEQNPQERERKPRATQDREQKTQDRSNRLATMARVLQENAKKETE